MKFPLKRFTVFGNSMLPILKQGQDVLVLCWFYRLKVGDLVAFKKDNKYMIKRIHYSSDRVIDVVGDNENKSTDSRNFGPIDRKDIIGKVIWH